MKKPYMYAEYEDATQPITYSVLETVITSIS